MSARAGWYPDPGGGQGLFRYWDGRAWSAATTTNPAAAPPVASLGTQAPSAQQQPGYGQGGGHAQTNQGYAGYGQASHPGSAGAHDSYAAYQATAARKRGPWGWWLAAGALLLAVVVVATLVVRGLSGGEVAGRTPTGSQPSQDVCPVGATALPQFTPQPADGRVHGGPLSYPELPAPWSAPRPEERVPFGVDVRTQTVTDQENYDNLGNSWVASVLVGELQAGDGFFTPEQGSQVVVRCILGKFYGSAEVRSDVRVNRGGTIDGHDAWTVESHLSFDIPNLVTKGELLIVTIVANGATAGIFYASIPDTQAALVEPTRAALRGLQVDS